MVQTLCNLTHCKPSCESNHMKHVVSYGKSHKTLKQVTHPSYILKIFNLLLSYTGDTESNLAQTKTTTEFQNRPTLIHSCLHVPQISFLRTGSILVSPENKTFLNPNQEIMNNGDCDCTGKYGGCWKH